jgi:ketosteroid isomerase-like protein
MNLVSRSSIQGQETMSKGETEVRKASEQFYAALNRMANGDSRPLTDVWSHSATATAMHPIGGRMVGWDKVRQSFEQVAEIASGGKVTLAEQVIHVEGDLAYEVGVERGQGKFGGKQVHIEWRVTNIYRREAGAWKVVHHHTDVSPAMVEAVNRLAAKA